MNNDRKKNISGECIAAGRKKSKLTQAELADRLRKAGLRIDRAGIAKIENGLRSVYDYELQAFARALNVPVGEMLGVKKQRI